MAQYIGGPVRYCIISGDAIYFEGSIPVGPAFYLRNFAYGRGFGFSFSDF